MLDLLQNTNCSNRSRVWRSVIIVRWDRLSGICISSWTNFFLVQLENREHRRGSASLGWFIGGWPEQFFGIAIVISSVNVRHTRGLLNVTGPGGHVDKDNDEHDHHSQRGQDDGGHLLPRFLHGLLPLLLVLGGLLLGLAFELSHVGSDLFCCAHGTL